MNVRLFSLCLRAVPLMAMAALSHADELMTWARIPLHILLAVGQERVVFVDKNVRVGFPSSLNGRLRVQSSGGAVYLRADAAFPQTRLQVQDVESGEVILLDVTASDKGPTEPVRIVYSAEVTSVSHRDNPGPAGEHETPATPGNILYHAPLPVLLTRYAAQRLYGPLRTVEALPGVHPVNHHLSEHITTLCPSEPVIITPLGSWGIGPRAVVALKVQNTASRIIILDPRVLQGQFVAATFQHRFLGPAGTPEDTTTMYLVTAGRPDGAFIAEPTAIRHLAAATKKGGQHGRH